MKDSISTRHFSPLESEDTNKESMEDLFQHSLRQGDKIRRMLFSEQMSRGLTQPRKIEEVEDEKINLFSTSGLSLTSGICSPANLNTSRVLISMHETITQMHQVEEIQPYLIESIARVPLEAISFKANNNSIFNNCTKQRRNSIKTSEKRSANGFNESSQDLPDNSRSSRSPSNRAYFLRIRAKSLDQPSSSKTNSKPQTSPKLFRRAFSEEKIYRKPKQNQKETLSILLQHNAYFKERSNVILSLPNCQPHNNVSPLRYQDKTLDFHNNLQAIQKVHGTGASSQQYDPPLTTSAAVVGLHQKWKKGGFLILTRVKKFTQKISERSYIRRFNKQTQHQFNVINDVSSTFVTRSHLCFYRFMLRLQQVLRRSSIFQRILNSKIPTIGPDSYFHVSSTAFMICVIIILFFLYPLYLAFSNEMKALEYMYSTAVQFLARDLPLCVWIIYALLRLNTGFYRRGIIEIDRWQILVNYIRTRLFFDALLILLFSILKLDNFQTIFAIQLLLINKLNYLQKELEDTITLQTKERSIYELAKLCVFVLVIAHFCGCLFWTVGVQTTTSEYGNTWVEYEGLDRTGFYEKYTSSLYWAVVTMLTVGYGDIKPINNYEKQVVILIMMFSCGVYAYSLNQIGVLIQGITSQDTEFKLKFMPISLYMKRRNLQVEIQNEVKRYYQYLAQEKSDTEGLDVMLSPLNQSLREKVLQSINLQLLQRYKMFSLHMSQEFLLRLALKMRESEFMPDDKVWEHSDLEQSNRLCFLVRGQVRQTLNKNSFEVRVIEEQEFFNEKAFVMDEAEMVCFTSTCVSTVVYLEKRDFLEVIKQFPLDYEIYCKLRDQAKNQDFLSVLNSKCETCDNYTHRVVSCPQVTYRVFQEKLIHRHNASQHQERRVQQRVSQYKPFGKLTSSNSDVSASYSNSSTLFDEKTDQPRFKAIIMRNMLFENIIDYMIDYNPLGLDDDNLIINLKEVVEYNENIQNQKFDENQDEEEDEKQSIVQGGKRGSNLKMALQAHRRISAVEVISLLGASAIGNGNVQAQQVSHQGRGRGSHSTEVSSMNNRESIQRISIALQTSLASGLAPDWIGPRQGTKNSSESLQEIPSDGNVPSLPNVSQVRRRSNEKMKGGIGSSSGSQFNIKQLVLSGQSGTAAVLKSLSRKHKKKISSILFQQNSNSQSPGTSVLVIDEEMHGGGGGVIGDTPANAAGSVGGKRERRKMKLNTIGGSQENVREKQSEIQFNLYGSQKHIGIQSQPQPETIEEEESFTGIEKVEQDSNQQLFKKVRVAEAVAVSKVSPKLQVPHHPSSTRKSFEKPKSQHLIQLAVTPPTTVVSTNIGGLNKKSFNSATATAALQGRRSSLNQMQQLQMHEQSESKTSLFGGAGGRESLFNHLHYSLLPHLQPQSHVSPCSPLFSKVAELDKAHIFQLYFPYNNLDRILLNIAKKYEETVHRRSQERKDECQLSKLEQFMQKFNSNRGNGRSKTLKFGQSQMRLSRNPTIDDGQLQLLQQQQQLKQPEQNATLKSIFANKISE